MATKYVVVLSQVGPQGVPGETGPAGQLPSIPSPWDQGSITQPNTNAISIRFGTVDHPAGILDAGAIK